MNVKFRHTNRVACHFSVTNWSTTRCTIIHETSIPRRSEIMILNHMDASIQKCRVLKCSCTPASQGSHQKPIKKNSEQQRPNILFLAWSQSTRKDDAKNRISIKLTYFNILE